MNNKKRKDSLLEKFLNSTVAKVISFILPILTFLKIFAPQIVIIISLIITCLLMIFTLESLQVLNFIVSLTMIVWWFKKKYHTFANRIRRFTPYWIAYWSSHALYYAYCISFGDDTNKYLELLLFNLNTAFIFVIYMLLHPSIRNIKEWELIIDLSFIVSMVALITISHFSEFLLVETEVVSGFIAFLCLCFLGNRLNAYFPKNYIPVIIFIYGVVQVLGNLQQVMNIPFAKESIFFIALIGKSYIGYLITSRYIDMRAEKISLEGDKETSLEKDREVSTI